MDIVRKKNYKNGTIEEIVNNIILSIEQNIYLPQSFNCKFVINNESLKRDLYAYIKNNSSR